MEIERKRKSEDAENGTPPKQQSLDSKRGSALDDKQNPQGPSSWDQSCAQTSSTEHKCISSGEKLESNWCSSFNPTCLTGNRTIDDLWMGCDNKKTYKNAFYCCHGEYFNKAQDSLNSAAEEAGLRLLKLETMSNWTNEILRQDQIIYAALDCVAMVRIVEHFKIPQSKKVIHNPLSTLGPHVDGIHNSRGSEHSLSLWHPREESFATDMPNVLFVASRGSESTPLPSMESHNFADDHFLNGGLTFFAYFSENSFENITNALKDCLEALLTLEPRQCQAAKDFLDSFLDWPEESRTDHRRQLHPLLAPPQDYRMIHLHRSVCNSFFWRISISCEIYWNLAAPNDSIRLRHCSTKRSVRHAFFWRISTSSKFFRNLVFFFCREPNEFKRWQLVFWKFDFNMRVERLGTRENQLELMQQHDKKFEI
ncbi:unnamed protein product [Caenorhabditis nigoni]